jgi:hypothetical protein
MGRFCGSTENVRSPDISSALTLMATSCSGLREERTLVCRFQTLSTFILLMPGLALR